MNITYLGTGNYNEYPLTGRVITWTYGQTQDVDSATATKLLAATGFVAIDDVNGVYSNNSLQLLVNKDGTTTSAGSPRNGIVSWRQHGGQVNVAVGLTRTFGQQIPCDKKFYGFRLISTNKDIAGARTIDMVKVAVAAIDGAAQTSLTWLPVTWSGATALVKAAATQGTVGGGGATVNKIETFYVSDPIWLTAVERTDIIGAPYLLQIMGYAADSYVGSWAVNTAGAETYFANRGYVYKSGQATADRVTTIADLTLTTSGYFGYIDGVEFFTGGDESSLHCFGDSLLHGANGAGGYQSGWPVMLDYKLRLLGKSQGISNWGVGGQLHENYIKRMKTMLDAGIIPQKLYFSSYSPNSTTSTKAGWNTQFAQTVEAIDYALKKGVKTIITSTAMPVNTNDASREQWRQEHNVLVRALVNRGVRVIDFDAVVKDPSDPSKINPIYSLDGTHINDAGQDKQADAVLAQLF